MKKFYESPRIAVERFSLTQHIASCSAVRISLTDIACVLNDPDAVGPMQAFAASGYFLDTVGCVTPVSDGDAGLCYHTSSAMAFTS